MDLKSASDEEKLNLCKKYFFGGCAFLPLLWIVNVCWFFRYAFQKTVFEQQTQIRKYVILSFVGSILWVGCIIAWIVVFQQNRVMWGETGDALSFVIPKGMA